MESGTLAPVVLMGVENNVACNKLDRANEANDVALNLLNVTVGESYVHINYIVSASLEFIVRSVKDDLLYIIFVYIAKREDVSSIRCLLALRVVDSHCELDYVVVLSESCTVVEDVLADRRLRNPSEASGLEGQRYILAKQRARQSQRLHHVI